MPIERLGEFLVMNGFRVSPSLGIESDNLDACVNEVNRVGIESVFACSFYGFREDNLDFLARMPQLTQVWFWDVLLRDVSGLYALRKLRYFGVCKRLQGIDFARLPTLREVVWNYEAKDTNLDTLPVIEHVDLWHFNPRSKSFAECELPTPLKHLGIYWANPASLDGLPYLPNCKELQIHRCRNLASLEGIDSIAPNLERLVMTTSGRCKDTSAVRRLTRLNHVWLNEPATNH